MKGTDTLRAFAGPETIPEVTVGGRSKLKRLRPALPSAVLHHTGRVVKQNATYTAAPAAPAAPFRHWDFSGGS